MSQRIDTQQVVETFRANHRDPRNLAMHAVGYWLIARAAKRLLTGHFFAALANLGAWLGVLVGGHRIEGSESFALLKQRGALLGNGRTA